MDTNADDLLLFARVMEAGSFSRAAERVHWPKSTVSRRIAGLEARLGEKLLQRSTRRLSLTDFGAGVLERAKAVAAEVDGALALALHRQHMPSGRLRVSFPPDFADLSLVALLERFSKAYPEVQMELDLTSRRVDLVAEGFDLAIRFGPLRSEAQLAARHLSTFQRGLFASPDYLSRHGEPLLPQALTAMHGLVLSSSAGDPVAWQLTSTQSGAVWSGLPEQRHLATMPSMLLRLAESGLGIAGADEALAHEAVQQGHLVRVLPDWCLPPAECWAVFPERRLMPLKTRVMLDALANQLNGQS